MFNKATISWLKYLIITLILLGLVFSTALYIRKSAREWLLDYQKSTLPEPQAVTEFNPSMSEEEVAETIEQQPISSPEPIKPLQSTAETETKIDQSSIVTDQNPKAELNLAVPFTSQAPHANWDELHEDFCEEASAVMVARFFANRSVDNADDADSELMKVYNWEVENLGVWKDTTAEETKRIIEGLYQLKVQIVDFDQNVIKQALGEGKPVILPAAGRKLKNPYYKQPGPLYHMLVIKGYTKDGQAITNDPGTKRGADYIYSFDRLKEAAGDFNNGDPENGRKVVLIVSKE